MTKRTAILFILLANIVLLAHAVLPHHHHKQQVCIEGSHCEEEEDISQTTAHGHQHDNHTNSATCVLKQAVIIPSTEGKFFKCCDNYSDNHSYNYYILFNPGNIDLQPISEVVAFIPVLPSFLTSSVTITPGLRAPPMV